MPKRKKRRSGSAKQSQIQLPRDALARVDLGQSFAEYDKVLANPEAFVKTPAIETALDFESARCFFIGRRGTGKTAITLYLEQNRQDTVQILPQAFVPLGLDLDPQKFRDTRQRHFQSLVHAFKRALQDEALVSWIERKLLAPDFLPDSIRRERNFLEDFDFDLRMSRFLGDTLQALDRQDDRLWLKNIKQDKLVKRGMEEIAQDSRWTSTLLIDRIDESWDGSETAVIVLMALMHACVELNAQNSQVRPLLFLRENMFERVRVADNEFARLETAVVSLDWTTALLVELVERRLSLPFNTKPPLHGPTWDYFFEEIEGESSRGPVLSFCQRRRVTFLPIALLPLRAQKPVDTRKSE